ncbi:ScbR family autoregulator-binding transcription factor [Streptomyces xiaopingdaonensis]|uniref:ScbR family autoregulator-binding transcription factor n=1 Tax=Streptomyces xiaopingdaonensis TaxID=1565415 RepID=UPI0002FC8EE7|nr:ScbR family autoregulator-binding transcription factor [Streptomyces xiaopingdaonensis]
MVKQQRSARTRERLVAAAAEEIAEHGFARATLADVSRDAGVTKGALFGHFATKDQLAGAVQSRSQDLLETAVEELTEGEPYILQVLVDLSHFLNTVLRDDPFVRASVRISRERAQGDPTPLDFFSLCFGRLWRLLELARKNGELGPAVADASARALVTAVVSGVETLTWVGVPRDEVEEWLSRLWALVLPLLAVVGNAPPVRTRAPSTGSTSDGTTGASAAGPRAQLPERVGPSAD